MNSNGKTKTAKVEIEVTGMKQAFNTWTMATATVAGKTYQIQMVCFEEPSQYGIGEGRISKLYIADADHTMLANYDRGWDKRPATATAKAIVNAVTAKFN